MQARGNLGRILGSAGYATYEYNRAGDIMAREHSGGMGELGRILG